MIVEMKMIIATGKVKSDAREKKSSTGEALSNVRYGSRREVTDEIVHREARVQVAYTSKGLPGHNSPFKTAWPSSVCTFQSGVKSNLRKGHYS